MNIYTHTHPFNSDLYTVIGMYKNLRNKHRKPVLLESNDYHSRAESKSIIGLNPLIEIKVFGAEIEVKTASSKAIHQVNEAKELQQKLVKLIEQNTFQNPNELNVELPSFSEVIIKLCTAKVIPFLLRHKIFNCFIF